ncbi:MAG: hypothetical protein ACREAC_23170, partial [Blastocatellia bacterium]
MNQYTAETTTARRAKSARILTHAGQDLHLVRVDKIASSTINLRLDHNLEITTDFSPLGAPKAGDVVIGRTLTDNATYNVLELVTGRQAKLNPGDVIAGVLGYRRALKG